MRVLENHTILTNLLKKSVILAFSTWFPFIECISIFVNLILLQNLIKFTKESIVYIRLLHPKTLRIDCIKVTN
jgi:hypothetical protein